MHAVVKRLPAVATCVMSHSDIWDSILQSKVSCQIIMQVNVAIVYLFPQHSDTRETVDELVFCLCNHIRYYNVCIIT